MDDPGTLPAVALHSIGCRTNQEEMVTLSAELARHGYRTVDSISDASIIIVNTCSVTGETESKTRRMLRSISREAPHARILVTGCLAQQRPEELAAMEGVAWVVGNGSKHLIDAIINRKDPGIFHAPMEQTAGEELPLPVVPLNPAEGKFFRRTRFPVKIQEGCDFRCSYCIVPSLRGPSRSAPVSAVVEACTRAVEAGYKELVLTGTHIGQYRNQGVDLFSLAGRLAGIPGDFRIRFSSLDPRDCTAPLLDLIGAGGRFCSHVHVSLQSCSAPVLDAMQRPADVTLECVDRLAAFRMRFPAAGIGADIITGFPGETDAQFDETCRHLERIGLTYVHTFRFSPRPGTPAAIMRGKVPEAQKAKRGARVRAIAAAGAGVFLERIRSTPQRIIVETRHPVRGITSNFIHVEIPECSLDRNSWLDVLVTGPHAGKYVFAKPALCKVA
jgi:threonylcarbamoyladenosine tRNA methylthiotransferase MtaB